MVRALLAGTKTQTRRIVKPQPPYRGFDESATVIKCPYGQPGDRLWVRETWAALGTKNRAPFVYRADTADGERVRVDAPWKSSIHMPLCASRISLDLLGVRCERLQEISAKDAIAEGLSYLTKDGGRTFKYGIPDRDGLPGTDNDGWAWQDWQTDPVAAYHRLWKSINGHGSWALNPWVWVISFSRVPAG